MAHAALASSPASSAFSAVDPVERVLDLESRTGMPVALAGVLAVGLHVGLAAAMVTMMLFAEIVAFNRAVHGVVTERLAQTYDIDTSEPEPEPAKPEPEPEPAKPEPEAAKPDPAPEPAVKAEPPPAAAQAGAVITQEPDPNEPVDLTGNTFVTGTGDSYAGGTTQAGGTSKTAVYSKAARAIGVPGGTGTATTPAAQGPDRSRPARLSGSGDWNDCPFPPEADAEQIDDAYVTIQVTVRGDGRAESASLLVDPGHGFGRSARKCAMQKRWEPALDRSGAPVATTWKGRIHFQR